jgi:hypothetical protein
MHYDFFKGEMIDSKDCGRLSEYDSVSGEEMSAFFPCAAVNPHPR